MIREERITSTHTAIHHATYDDSTEDLIGLLIQHDHGWTLHVSNIVDGVVSTNHKLTTIRCGVIMFEEFKYDT